MNISILKFCKAVYVRYIKYLETQNNNRKQLSDANELIFQQFYPHNSQNRATINRMYETKFKFGPALTVLICEQTLICQ